MAWTTQLDNIFISWSLSVGVGQSNSCTKGWPDLHHGGGRAHHFNWSENSFIMVVYEKFFLFNSVRFFSQNCNHYKTDCELVKITCSSCTVFTLCRNFHYFLCVKQQYRWILIWAMMDVIFVDFQGKYPSNSAPICRLSWVINYWYCRFGYKFVKFLQSVQYLF